jgi:predicted enzyme related to lactoylglutathione lyase
MWIHDHTPARDPGMVTYILADSIEATLKKVTAKGGKIAIPATPLRPNGEACATILDPAGNLVGIYQVGRH